MTRFEETNWGDAARAEECRDNADHYVPERQLLVSVLASFFSIPFPFRLTPGGIVRGVQALLLNAVAAYCAHRTEQRT